MLEGYAEAAQVVTELVGRVPPDAWDAPALGEWDLRSLVGHTSRAFVTVLTYLERPADTEDIDSPEGYYALMSSMTGEGIDQSAVAQRGRDAGVALGDDPAAAFATLAERAVAATRAADPDALITTIAGGMRVASYVPTRTIELVVHGYDIADGDRARRGVQRAHDDPGGDGAHPRRRAPRPRPDAPARPHRPRLAPAGVLGGLRGLRPT